MPPKGTATEGDASIIETAAIGVICAAKGHCDTSAVVTGNGNT